MRGVPHAAPVIEIEESLLCPSAAQHRHELTMKHRNRCPRAAEAEAYSWPSASSYPLWTRVRATVTHVQPCSTRALRSQHRCPGPSINAGVSMSQTTCRKLHAILPSQPWDKGGYAYIVQYHMNAQHVDAYAIICHPAKQHLDHARTHGRLAVQMIVSHLCDQVHLAATHKPYNTT